MRRIFLFLTTNLVVLFFMSAVSAIVGLFGPLESNLGVSWYAMLLGCLIVGFAGSAISLFSSRASAMHLTGARFISGTEGMAEAWLIEVVRKLTTRAGVPMPQVAIYVGPPNAFATGASKSRALIAVSEGLLMSLDRTEVEAVIAHEVAHIANGDMVTMALLQGVVNTFVLSVARAVGRPIDRWIFKNNGRSAGIAYSMCVLALQLGLGLLASLVVASFSRAREFRADAGAVQLLGTNEGLVSALKALDQVTTRKLCDPLGTFGIVGGFRNSLATHPPLDQRISAVQALPPRGAIRI